MQPHLTCKLFLALLLANVFLCTVLCSGALPRARAPRTGTTGVPPRAPLSAELRALEEQNNQLRQQAHAHNVQRAEQLKRKQQRQAATAAAAAAHPSSSHSSSIHLTSTECGVENPCSWCSVANLRHIFADTCLSAGQAYVNSGQQQQSTYTQLPHSGGLYIWGANTAMDDAALTSHDFYFGTAVSAVGKQSTVQNGAADNSQAVLAAVVTGSVPATACGAYLSGVTSVKNFARVSATVSDGASAGLFISGSAFNIHNYASGNITAVGSQWATGVSTAGGVMNFVNDGYLGAWATGVTYGKNKGLGSPMGHDLYSWASDMYMLNNGRLEAFVTGAVDGGSGPYGANCWLSGSGHFTYINNGWLNAQSSVSAAIGIYHGSSGGENLLSINNGFVIANTTKGGGWGWGYEEDSGFPSTIINTGYIWHSSGPGLYIHGPSNDSHMYIVNTGTIEGNMYGIGVSQWEGSMQIKTYGSVKGPNNPWMPSIWSPAKVKFEVFVYGLPDMWGWITGADTSVATNYLHLDLMGVLQQVNDQPVSSGGGTGDLSVYNLGVKGSIVVSGKTYKWDHMQVSGTVSMNGVTTACASAADGGELRMQCGGSDVISGFLFASYGTPSGTCGAYVQSGCHASTSTDILNTLCLTRQSCVVAVNAATFLNASTCAGTHLLNVQYMCAPNRLTAADLPTGSYLNTVTALPSCSRTSSEGAPLTLSCTHQQIISTVDFASYGTPSGTCSSGFLTSTCHAQNSTAVVRAKCVGRQSCTITGSNDVFGDPCMYVGKYLAAEVTCGPPPTTCTQVGEGGNLNLFCLPGQTISSVDFASYGTAKGTCSSGFSVSSCHAGNSLSLLQSSCVGKNSCVVQASNTVFGDPCPGTAKNLAASVTCQ